MTAIKCLYFGFASILVVPKFIDEMINRVVCGFQAGEPVSRNFHVADIGQVAAGMAAEVWTKQENC